MPCAVERLTSSLRTVGSSLDLASYVHSGSNAIQFCIKSKCSHLLVKIGLLPVTIATKNDRINDLSYITEILWKWWEVQYSKMNAFYSTHVYLHILHCRQIFQGNHCAFLCTIWLYSCYDTIFKQFALLFIVNVSISLNSTLYHGPVYREQMLSHILIYYTFKQQQCHTEVNRKQT